jgi:hypothetical protein
MATIDELERQVRELDRKVDASIGTTSHLQQESAFALDKAMHSYQLDEFGYLWVYNPETKTYHRTKMRVLTPEIARCAVRAVHIAEGAITGDKFHAGAVIPGKIANDAVTTRNIKNRAVTFSKLSEEVQREIVKNWLYVVKDKGDWEPDTPYYHDKLNEETLQYETDKVRHNGGMWLCMISQPIIIDGVEVYHEPRWKSPYWMLVDCSGGYTIEFMSSKGYSFRKGFVNTDIVPHLFFGTVDITADIPAEFWSWQRSTERGKSIQDISWDAQHEQMKTIHLSNEDMPLDWGVSNKAIFKLTVVVDDGKEERIVDNYVIC